MNTQRKSVYAKNFLYKRNVKNPIEQEFQSHLKRCYNKTLRSNTSQESDEESLVDFVKRSLCHNSSIRSSIERSIPVEYGEDDSNSNNSSSYKTALSWISSDSLPIVTEEYLYKDEEKGVELIETRLCVLSNHSRYLVTIQKLSHV